MGVRHHPRKEKEVKKELLKFWSQRSKAKHRGIEFHLTFEQWYDIWQQSGKWEQRGCRKGQYVMSRNNDIGPYAMGNVFIQLSGENHKDSHIGNSWNTGKKYSQERTEKRLDTFYKNKQEKELANG